MSERSPSALTQLKAMLRRNVLLKKRQASGTIAEVLIPCIILVSLCWINAIMPNPYYPEIRSPQGGAKLLEIIQQFPYPMVAIAPNTAHIQDFLGAVNNMWQSTRMGKSNQAIMFSLYGSEDELIKAYKNNPISVLIAVIFHDDPITNGLSYVICTNPSVMTTPRTDELMADPKHCRDIFSATDPCPVNTYYKSGFVALQVLLDYTKIQLDSKRTDIELPDVFLQLLPKAAHTTDAVSYMQKFMSSYLIFAFSIFITYLLILIVSEKEKKIKEAMHIMGLRDSIYWISWFIIYSVFMLIISLVGILIIFELKTFQHSNLILIFLLIYLYCLSLIMFTFMITPFFSKSRTAASCAVFIQGGLFLGDIIETFMEDIQPPIFWIASLLCSMAFGLGMKQAIILDKEGTGVQLDNLWSGSRVPFGGCLIMLVVDILLYGFLAFYLESIIPSEHGVKRGPCFCLSPRYWCGKSTVMNENPRTNRGSRSSKTDEENNDNVEPVAREMKDRVAIKIINLHKIFKKCLQSKKVKAVNGFDLTIYEDQITAIIGHNAAGKTTIFNIMTGLTAPTSGTIKIFGYDIRKSNDMTEIQKMIGVCPQYDILFDVLTPREHLSFYARVKGVPASLVVTEVERTLKDIDLTDKADAYSKNLSGGQKRKLSIGIALIGDPKIIILDEPTAGVDPYSRRHLWTLLQNQRKGKVILLTTHFMDEADILADRKAFVSKGRLQCCGSSLFLKNKFGIGYHLALVLGANVQEQPIQQLVTSYIRQAEKARRHGRELTFILPRTAVGNFPALFQAIEQEINQKRLGITSYGISMTTLEEVFLQLEPVEGEGKDKTMADISKKTEESKDGADNAAENPAYDQVWDNIQLKPNVMQSLLALLRVRCLRMFRALSKYLIVLLLPAIMTVVAIMTQPSTVKKMSSLGLNLDTYPVREVAMFNNSGKHIDDLLNAMSAEGMTDVTQYKGNFSSLLDLAPHILAYNIDEYDIPRLSMTTMYNDTLQHSLPIAINLISNAYYRLVMGNTSMSSIKVHTHPFESTSDTDSALMVFTSSFAIGLAIVVLPAMLMSELVNDREFKVKNQLRVNGLSFCSYFTSYFLVLFVIIFLSYCGILVVVMVMNKPATLYETPSKYMLLIFLFFFTLDAMLTFACWTYLFQRSETAESFMQGTAILSGLVSFFFFFLYNIIVKNGIIKPMYINAILSFAWTPYIPFAMLYHMGITYLIFQVYNDSQEMPLYEYMTKDIIIIMAATITHILISFLLLVILDIRDSGGSISDICRQFLCRNDKEAVVENNDVSDVEDSDVKDERKNVAMIMSTKQKDPPVVVVQNLRKEYKTEKVCCNSTCFASKVEDEENPRTKVVVRNISLAVEEGEVFGLLGHNGAGKTTIMRIIIAEESATKGRVQICGQIITSNPSAAFKELGYCPQHNALWSNITIREHLQCYAAIRGVKPKDINRVVDMYIKGLQIEEHADKQSEKCSGGTKRKLSFAMAMAGDPRIVLLDEPSTGMDPRSKRFLWDTILASFHGTRGAILITHSMEEADALCSRVGILVKGSLRCIGSTQHLKNKFGAGYSLEMKLRHSDRTSIPVLLRRNQDIQKFVNRIFKDANLEESFGDHLVFIVPQSSVTSLAKCFEQLEKSKTELEIEEYSFSQSTLEQVFLKLARDNANT